MLIVLQSQDKLESIFAFIKPYKYYGKKYWNDLFWIKARKFYFEREWSKKDKYGPP
jgi:hypothetical protein